MVENGPNIANQNAMLNQSFKYGASVTSSFEEDEVGVGFKGFDSVHASESAEEVRPFRLGSVRGGFEELPLL